MKNACIVGYGAIGPVHAGAVQKTPGACLYAVCDTNSQKRKAAKEVYPGIKIFSDFDCVLDDPEIDVIHICTPHHLHAAMACSALSAGKNVVLEKPVCLNEAEFLQIKNAQSRSSGKVCVMFQNRTNPCFLKLMEELSHETLGTLCAICGFLTWHRDAAYYQADAWRGKWETEGGALLVNQAIHMIDLINLLSGGITAVTGSISTKLLKGVIEAEDTADAVFETSKHIRACFFATNCCDASLPMHLEIHGKKGILRYADNLLYKISNGSCNVLASDFPPETGKSYWGCGHTEVIRSFYRHLETGTGYFIPLQDTEQTMKALFAFYQSAKSSERITLI